MKKKATTKKAEEDKGSVKKAVTNFEMDNGFLMQAGNTFYPAQYFKRVTVASEGCVGAMPGDLVFEFTFHNGTKETVVEPSNNHIRKKQLARINRQYAKGMEILTGGKGGCGK